MDWIETDGPFPPQIGGGAGAAAWAGLLAAGCWLGWIDAAAGVGSPTKGGGPGGA